MASSSFLKIITSFAGILGYDIADLAEAVAGGMLFRETRSTVTSFHLHYAFRIRKFFPNALLSWSAF